MELVTMDLRSFSDELASDSAAPGGGSVSALAGALGCALAAMVCGLTLGRKKYEAAQALAEQTLAQASVLREKLLQAVDADTKAFLVISEAYRMPKKSEEEKQLRSAAIQAGLDACTRSPLAIMELGTEGLRLAEKLSGGYNLSAASDLGVSALMLKAAVQGAFLNVRINLAGLKNKEQAAAYEAQGRALLEEALAVSERVLAAAEAAL